MPDERPVLEVRDLNCWHGAHKVLRDIHINVRKGNICGLLGPNGSGKTTLFRCILNFHKAYAGAVHICGHSTRKLPPARMARLVSYVPQEHHAAFPFSVRDIVRMGRNPFLAAAFHFGQEHGNQNLHQFERGPTPIDFDCTGSRPASSAYASG